MTKFWIVPIESICRQQMLTQKKKSVFHWVENIVWKGENASYQDYLHSHHVFKGPIQIIAMVISALFKHIFTPFTVRISQKQSTYAIRSSSHPIYRYSTIISEIPECMIQSRLQSFRIFSRLAGQDDPWSKIWWVIFWNDAPNHIKLKISANIRTCNGTRTRLVTEVIQKKND